VTLTYWTFDLGHSPEIDRNAQQLSLGIADIKAREPASPVISDALIPSEAVLKLSKTRKVIERGRTLRAGCHADRVAATAQIPTDDIEERRPTLCSESTYRVDTSICYAGFMLEFAILGLLKERSMHGYDLRKHLRDDFGVLANLSFGSLYPALGRLEASGAIRSIGSGTAEIGYESSVLSTGSLGGERAATVARRATAKVAETLGRTSTRARKVYEITPIGEQLFEQQLEATSSTDSDQRGFSLRLAFARYLSPQARIRLLERRRMELADHLQKSSAHLDRPARILDTYERSLAEHARDCVANDLTWVEQLLDRERSLADASPGAQHLGSTNDNTITTVQPRVDQNATLAHDGGISA
jgi:DNA-binding PadR family transcriptional regulator